VFCASVLSFKNFKFLGMKRHMALEIWNTAADCLRKSLGQNNFKSWIEPLKFIGEADGIAEFSVPTSFFGNYVRQHFEDQILYQVRKSGLQVSRLVFTVSDFGLKSQLEETRGVTGDISKQRDIAGSKLDPRFLFDNFVVGKPNELAHAASKRVAEAGSSTFNPLFLYGGVGLGKTHLMHAIAWELQTSRPDINVMYLSAEQFMYRFVQALRERKMMDFKELFRSVDVLMVDDVQFIAGKDSTQEEFFHTFNALVDQNKQIIISADRAPGEIKHLEDRIASRLQCGLVVDLHPTTYELRLGILQSKIELYQSSYPGIEVRQEVVEFLAHRISNNVRVLEGALTRLFAFASLVGREITVELTQDCLSDILRASDRKTTVEEIQRKVSDHYNIRLSDMLGPKRLRNFARPRQIAMYLCKQLTTRSLPEIGRRFGGRDHTTVMHGVRRIEDLRNQDSQISDDLDMLRRSLEG
jgi:chromosomal replication initiator protein|tara:strand:+ start:2782 stop:4188 length:1407 start_codon:yes stop_codon:yes gene_type:complete